MIIKKIFEIDNIKFDLRYKLEQVDKRPLVLFFHGFKSFRNWGFIPHICSKLASAGYPVINIDFEFNGIKTENPVEFDVEKFSENTVSKELDNALIILNMFKHLHNAEYFEQLLEKKILDSEKSEKLKNLHELLSKFWDGKVNLVGHSRGGGISILAAEESKMVDKIGLLAPIAYFDRYTTRLKTKWKSDGYLEFNDAMSKQTLRINSEYVLDIEHNAARFDLQKTAEMLSNPVLIIHGENDVSVPFSEVSELVNSFKKNEKYHFTSRNFVIIKKANHLFNINHPFESSNSYLDEVCDLLVKFFDEK